MWRKFAEVIFWVGLSVYFGGLVAVGAIVAPAVFQSATNAHVSMPGIASPPLDMPREVGGEIFGAVLNRFAYLEAAALVLMFIGLAAWILGNRHVRWGTWLLLALWSLVAALTIYDSASLRPRVWELRQARRDTAAAHASAAPNTPWPEDIEFDGLHRRSEMLGRVKAYALLAMLLITAWRSLRSRAESRPGDAPQFRDPLIRTMSKQP